MKSIFLLGALALPGAAKAHDEGWTPACRRELIRETFYVRVPVTYRTYDPCRGGHVLSFGYRTEPLTRRREVWICSTGCSERPRHSQDPYFRAR